MTKLFAVALAVGALGWAVQASANCPGHQQTATVPQTVVDSSGTTTAPMTPIPTPDSKSGG
ncbi:MAG: hypothetical protein IRY94_12165 [Rhodospirillaceae bacterium]|nr:hypothetical protein [Rhodospirillaceae bacterium]